MPNVFNLLKPQAKLPRNRFDLDQTHTFGLKCGMLTPVFCQEYIPNDQFKIDVSALIRTAPMQTDNFTDMKQRVDFYAVPYSMLWHRWDEFIMQVDDPRTAYAKNHLFAPCLDLGLLLNDINECFQESETYTDDPAHMGEVDKATYNVFLRNAGYEMLRMLDLLGYGAYYSLMDSFIRPAEGQTLQELQNANSAARAQLEGKLVNVFRIGAFNAIWYHFFRNKYYDNNPDYVKLFNFDDLDCSSAASAQVHYDGSYLRYPQSLFMPRYHMWRKDMFMGLLPDPQFGAVSAVSLGDFKLINKSSSSDATGAAIAGINGTFNNAPSSLYRTGLSDSDSWSSDASISVYQIKQAMMMQSWKEDHMRAGNDLGAQYRAMFGGSPDRLDYDKPRYIGSYDERVGVKGVEATAATEQALLGDLGGRGVSVGGTSIRFKSNDEFGVIIGVMSIVPDSVYDATGLDQHNVLFEPFDFVTPKFENLGFEGVYRYQLDNIPNYIEGEFSNLRNELGFAPSYLREKTAISKVHGNFMATKYYRIRKGSNHQPGFEPQQWTEFEGGSMQHFNVTRRDLAFRDSLSLSSLYINPSIIDTIFYPQNVSDLTQESDQFIVNMDFRVSAVRPLSVMGLPKWS